MIPAIRFSSINELKQKWQIIKNIVDTNGYVRLRPTDCKITTLKQVANLFGYSQKHVRNTRSGITQITGEACPNKDKKVQVVSNTEFFPHTDGSYLNGMVLNKSNQYFRVGPPRFIFLQCVQPAIQGGASYLVDANKILPRVIQNDKALLPALFAPNGISIMRGDQIAMDVPVFKRMPNERYSIRYGYDKDLFFSKKYAELFASFNKKYILNDEYTSRFTLEKNEILLTDNQRLLHGRTMFTGQRIMRRLWLHDDINSEEMVQIEQKDKPYYQSQMSTGTLLKSYKCYEKINRTGSKSLVERIETGISLPSITETELRNQLLKLF